MEHLDWLITLTGRPVLTSFADKTKKVPGDTQTEYGKAKRFKGRFVWVDGPLVRALKDGTWFILDNTNLCNPSVLDRLNSLCEPGGVLTLTERGLVGGEPQVLRPHSNFRLFMAMDPANGELSRAMRNRGIEIYIDNALQTEDGSSAKFHSSASTNTVVPSSGQLDALCHHLGSRSMRHLILLLSKFEKLSLETLLKFLLQHLSRPACFLFLRLKKFSLLRSALSAFLGSHANILEFLGLVADQLALPQGFIGAEVRLSVGFVNHTETMQSVEPLLNAHVYARIKNRGLLKFSEWNSVRLATMFQLWKVDSNSEKGRGLIGEDSVLEISRNITHGRSFGNDVAPEIKAIYPVLSSCRSFLDRLVTTVSPVHVSSLVVSQQFPLLMLNIGCYRLPCTC
jgi:AAA domain (dynein-related subfamily)